MALYSLSRDQYDDDDEVPSLHGGIDVVNMGCKDIIMIMERLKICWQVQEMQRIFGRKMWEGMNLDLSMCR